MKNIFLFSRYTALLAIIFSLCLTGCSKNDRPMPSGSQGPDIDFFALGKNNQLLLINGKNTSVSKSTVAITGLQPAETIMGIDFRPNTGQLFGVGSTSRL